MTEAYCVKCRAKRQISGARNVTLRNGKRAVQGSCPVCTTKLFRIGG
jgi:hypothetical protein